MTNLIISKRLFTSSSCSFYARVGWVRRGAQSLKTIRRQTICFHHRLSQSSWDDLLTRRVLKGYLLAALTTIANCSTLDSRRQSPQMEPDATQQLWNWKIRIIYESRSLQAKESSRCNSRLTESKIHKAMPIYAAIINTRDQS